MMVQNHSDSGVLQLLQASFLFGYLNARQRLSPRKETHQMLHTTSGVKFRFAVDQRFNDPIPKL